MRIALKCRRIKAHMTQEDVAEAIGYTRSAYTAVETGQRDGRMDFWQSVKSVLQVPSEEMWDLMQNDEYEDDEM